MKKFGSVLLMIAVVCAMGGIVGCPATKTTPPPPAGKDAPAKDAPAKDAPAKDAPAK